MKIMYGYCLFPSDDMSLAIASLKNLWGKEEPMVDRKCCGKKIPDVMKGIKGKKISE